MPHSESSVRSATRPSWGACYSSSRCSGSSTSPAQVASWIAFLGDSSCSFCSTCEVGRACLTSCGKPSKRGATPRPPRLQRPLASSSSKLTGAALPGSRWPACSSSGPRWRPELPVRLCTSRRRLTAPRVPRSSAETTSSQPCRS